MLFAFRIPMTEPHHLSYAIARNKIPTYSAYVAPAIQHTIRCIHGIDKIMENTEVTDLEVYIGRASTLNRVRLRWLSHHESRKHKWAAILFSASRNHSKLLEKAAIRVLKSLKNRKALCIGNANIIGGATGPITDVENEFIYMTWGYVTDQNPFDNKPSTQIIHEVSHDVAHGMNGLVTPNQIRTGLRPVTAPLTQYEKLEWYSPE